jgi:hypothetical protein
MRVNNFVLQAVMASILQTSLGYPAGEWNAKFQEIQARGVDPNTGPNDSSEMIGDLIYPGAITPVGQARTHRHALYPGLFTDNL